MDLNRLFSKEMVNKHKKRCSVSVSREMEINTTMLLLHTHQDGYNQRQIMTNVGRNVEKLESSFTCCCWECKMVQPLGKTAWQCLRNLNIHLAYDPAIPHLGQEKEKFIFTDTCTRIFISALFIIIGIWKQLNIL